MKRIIITAMVLLIASKQAYGLYGLKKWRFDIVDSDIGLVIADANFTVTVYEAGGSAATIYSDEYATSKTNPITPVSDASAGVGSLSFYSAATSLDIQIASSVYTGVVKITSLGITDHRLVYPLGESLGNIAAGTLSASGAVTMNGNVTLGNAVTDNVTVTGAVQGTNAIYFDGTTDNTIELILAITDPTSADKTVTLPDATGTVMLSSLATNAPDIANSITGGTNQLIFEGSGVDAFEAILTATNPTADVVWTLPDATAMTVAFMSSTLATNMPDIANSIWGGTNQLIFEGSGVDAFEALITATNPTADVIWTLPDAGAMTVAFMSSTLATNMPDVANSITGGTNQLIFEGATANDFETFVTPIDATADRTITLPNDSGTVLLSTLSTNAQDAANSIWGGTNQLIFEGGTEDAFETILTCTQATAIDKTITLPNVTGTVLLDTSAIRTAQQYVQTIGYCKVGTTAGWVVPAAADAAHVATLPQSQTGSTLVIPINIPLKVGYTITAWTINGQIDSGGNTATLDARLYKHTEATAGFANAAIGSGMAQLSKTADYKVVEGEASLTEVVAADESYYLLVTGTTAATTDIEIASITVTVSEL